MLQPLRLLLPALIPSWNFFDVIAASPRVEYVLLPTETDQPLDWREFRPRPARVSLATMVKRLVWNPRWNESLLLVSCAERLIDQPTEHGESEILSRIAAELAGDPDPSPWLAFRLTFLRREGETLIREVLFQSSPRRREALVR